MIRKKKENKSIKKKGEKIKKKKKITEDIVKNNIHSDNVSKGERMYVTVIFVKPVSLDLVFTTFITQYIFLHQYLTFMINQSLSLEVTPLFKEVKYKLIITINFEDYILK